MYLLGYDIGTSSVKACLLNAETGEVVAGTHYPEKELAISSPQQGWAEQEPDLWWDCVVAVTKKLLSEKQIDPAMIKAIGISYQMHGLVLVDKNKEVLRPAIIWCDSRAVEIGNKAFEAIGEEACLTHLLNSPGNFTASKLRWVKEKNFTGLKYLFLYETDNFINSPDPIVNAISLLEKDKNLAACGFTVKKHNGDNAGYGSSFPSVLSLVLGQQFSFILKLHQQKSFWNKKAAPC